MLRRLICRFAALALLCSVSIATPAHAAEVAMAGQGSAVYKKKKDAMIAREDAVDAAIRDAIKKTLAARMTREQIEKYFQTIETQVLPIAKTFVKHQEIVDETDRDGTYTVTIKAVFDEAALTANLDAIGFSQDVGSRRTIAVVIDEFFQGDLPPSTKPFVSRDVVTHSVDANYDASIDASASRSSTSAASGSAAASQSYGAHGSAAGYGGAASHDASGSASGSEQYAASSDDRASGAYAERESAAYHEFFQSVKEYFPAQVLKQPRDSAAAAAISEQLLARDVRLSDPGQVASMRSAMIGDQGMLLDVLNDPAAVAERGARIGTQFGVDAVMTGVSAITYSGYVGGRHTASATLAIKIVDTATGDIVASTTSVQNGSGVDSNGAAADAARRLGTTIGTNLGEQLFRYWKKRDEKGIEISMRLIGIDSTRVAMGLEEALGGVEGAIEVRQRVFDRTSKLLEYVITTREPLDKFKRSVLKALYAVPELQNMEDESSLGATWNFVAH